MSYTPPLFKKKFVFIIRPLIKIAKFFNIMGGADNKGFYGN